MEIDVNDRNPFKFWAAAVGVIVTLTGGSGVTSYTMAQQATAETAAATAKETASKLIDQHRIEANVRFDELEKKVEANGKEVAAIGRDVQWIRQTLEKIEQRQYDRSSGR